KKQGDSKMNDFGLPNQYLKSNSKADFKKNVEQKISAFSTLTKVAIGSAVFNILVIFFLFLIPKNEIPVQVIDIYGREIKSGRSNQHHFYIRTNEGEFEISEQIS